MVGHQGRPYCYLTPARYGVYNGQLKIIVQPSEAAEILSAACLVSRSAGRETMSRIILSQLKWQGAKKAARPTSL